MLTLDNVSVKRANSLLFEPISCVMKPGEILTFQGESGRGKSTLLHALIHEEPQVELVGQITLDGQCMDMSVRLVSARKQCFRIRCFFRICRLVQTLLSRCIDFLDPNMNAVLMHY